MRSEDLGRLRYRDAWDIQRDRHAAVRDGAEETLLLVEHEPVITFGRRGDSGKHLLASQELLGQMGVEVVESDRGGDITFHGPGQLVAYPILRLADHGLSVGGYVHSLEAAVIDTLSTFDVAATTDSSAVGVWIEKAGQLAKICAIGVRVSRGVSLHGLALNVDTDLNYFKLINPCGLPARAVTSLREVLENATPPAAEIKVVLAEKLIQRWVHHASLGRASIL